MDDIRSEPLFGSFETQNMSISVELMSPTSMIFAGKRLPNDPLFVKGNNHVPYLKRYGVLEEDNEDLLHKPVSEFRCSFYKCNSTFDSVFKFEQHYNLSHRLKCAECSKVLGSAHLLDLHVSERHDSYFAVQVGKKPMFCCFIEECPEVFMDITLRRDHVIKFHKFPGAFPFDDPPPAQKKKEKPAKKTGKSDGGKMEVDKKVKNFEKPLGFRRGKHQTLELFTKDLAASLPN